MKNRSALYLVFILSFSLLALWGCPKKAEVTAAPEQKEAPAPAPAPQEEAKPEVAPAPAPAK